MGWNYTEKIGYGIHVKSWGNVGMEALLDKHRRVVGYSKNMSLMEEGTIFVYVNSTYTEDYDSGAYAFSSPDISGTAFKPPKHPCFHKQDTYLKVPELTEDEHNVLVQIEEVSGRDQNERMWVSHAYIDY